MATSRKGVDRLREDFRGPEGRHPLRTWRTVTHLSALKLFDAFPTPHSRTGLLNAAASRPVEWFHLTTQEILLKNKNLKVCFAERRNAKPGTGNYSAGNMGHLIGAAPRCLRSHQIKGILLRAGQVPRYYSL
jgi:hypothetical protein